jgi:hypothetical protein
MLGYVDSGGGGALAVGAALVDVDDIGCALASVLGADPSPFGTSSPPVTPRHAFAAQTSTLEIIAPDTIWRAPPPSRVSTLHLVVTSRAPALVIQCGASERNGGAR